MRKFFLNALFALLGNFIVAFVGLTETLEFLKDRVANFAHLIAQVHHRKMIVSVFCRPIGFTRGQLKVLRAQF